MAGSKNVAERRRGSRPPIDESDERPSIWHESRIGKSSTLSSFNHLDESPRPDPPRVPIDEAAEIRTYDCRLNNAEQGVPMMSQTRIAADHAEADVHSVNGIEPPLEDAAGPPGRGRASSSSSSPS